MGITRNNRSKRRATGGKKKHYRKARKYELGRQPTFTKIGERKITLVRKRGGSFKRRALRLDSGNFAWATEAIARKTRILNVSYNASSNELVRTNTLVKNCIIQVDATPFRTWYEQHYGVNLGKTRKQDPTKAGAKRPAPKKNEKRLVKKIKLPPRKLKDLQKREARHKRKVALKKKEKAEAGKDKKKDEKTGKDSTTTTKSAGKTGKSADSSTKKEKKEGEKKEKRVTDSERRKRSALRKRVAPVDVHLAEQFQGGRLYACVSTRPGQDGGADGYILEGKELEFYLKKLQKKKSGK